MMVSRKEIAFLILTILVGTVLSACSSSASGDAAAAVETYLDALVSKDANQLISVSCADWEESARLELDSFQAVDAELQDVACSVSDEEGEYTVVECAGNIVTTYDNENQQLDLSRRPYITKQEGGDWRVCGYYQP